MVLVGGGAFERRCARAELVLEDVCPSFQVANGAAKKRKWRGQWGLGLRWLLLHGETQQPTESRPYRWSIFVRGGAQGEDDWGERRHTFLAIRFRGKKEYINIRCCLRRPPIDNCTQQPTKLSRALWWTNRRGRATVRERRGGRIRPFWGRSSWEGGEYTKK